jgi:hypothetical protein
MNGLSVSPNNGIIGVEASSEVAVIPSGRPVRGKDGFRETLPSEEIARDREMLKSKRCDGIAQRLADGLHIRRRTASLGKRKSRLPETRFGCH